VIFLPFLFFLSPSQAVAGRAVILHKLQQAGDQETFQRCPFPFFFLPSFSSKRSEPCRQALKEKQLSAANFRKKLSPPFPPFLSFPFLLPAHCRRQHAAPDPLENHRAATVFLFFSSPPLPPRSTSPARSSISKKSREPATAWPTLLSFPFFFFFSSF